MEVNMKQITKLILSMMLLTIFSASSVYGIGEIVGQYLYRSGNVGCTYDTANDIFYVYHEAEYTVYKLDGASYTPLDTLPLPFNLDVAGYAWSMTFDGTYLWLALPWGTSGEGRLYAMDPATGDSVTYINTGLGEPLRGVDWDGTNFWIGTNTGNDRWIFKIDPTGAHLDSFEVTSDVAWLNQICLVEDEIWINNDRLWFTSYDKSGNFIKTINSSIPGPWAQMSHDLTFDGNDVVTVCWARPYIYQIYVGKGHGQYLFPVTDLTASSSSSTPTSITLNFTVPTMYVNGNAGAAVSFNVYNFDTYELMATGTTESIEVTNLTTGQAYSFFVRAEDGDGYQGMLSEKVGTRAGGPLAGDLLDKLPMYTNGWTSIAWDGYHAWVYNENLAYFAKVDITSGDTLKTVPFAQWSNGCLWDDTDGTIWLNSPGTGIGEVWQIDTLGNLVSWFPTDLDPANSCRGIAWDGSALWVGQTDLSTFWLFDKSGQDLGTVYADVAIGWQRGMAWIEGQLWILDGGTEKLRIFDYNGVDSLHQVTEVSYWWEGWPLDLTYTGNEVIVAGWESSDLFFLYPGEVTGIADGFNKLINTFSLAQNYPNPFNPETHIVYTLPKAEKVQLEIYNTLGQKVATVVNEKQVAGKHEVIWNGKTNSGTQAASGIYFYKLVAEDFTKVRKMMLIR
jgi:hypothetical protein